MSNDPKYAVVDLDKLKANKQPKEKQNNLNNNVSSMITNCNEGADLINIETSTQNESMIGHENCNKNEKENKDS